MLVPVLLRWLRISTFKRLPWAATESTLYGTPTLDTVVEAEGLTRILLEGRNNRLVELQVMLMLSNLKALALKIRCPSPIAAMMWCGLAVVSTVLWESSYGAIAGDADGGWL